MILPSISTKRDPRIPFADAEDREIEKIYRVGLFSTLEIARQYHRTHSTISRAIRRVGGKKRTAKESAILRAAKYTRHPRISFTEAEDREIEKIYRAGLFSTCEIARQYHCVHTTIGSAIRRAGGKVRTGIEAENARLKRGLLHPGRLFSDDEEQEIADTYRAEGQTVEALAQKRGCNWSTIRNILDRRQVQRLTLSEAHCIGRPLVRERGNGGYPTIGISRLKGKAYDMARRMKGGGKEVSAHRLIMALHLRRPLFPTEIVHHKDGNKANYHINNLELLTKETHTSGWGNPYYQKWQEALTAIKRLRAETVP